MYQRRMAFDDLRSDPRLRCILCESLLPTPASTAASVQLPDPICLRCWTLAPDERRLLHDQAMERVSRIDFSR